MVVRLRHGVPIATAKMMVVAVLTLLFVCSLTKSNASDVSELLAVRKGRIRERHLLEASSTTTNADVNIEPRIVGGQVSTVGAYPFFVNTDSGELCGGTLVHSDVVLTAAHCLDAFVPGLHVNIGSNFVSGTQDTERINIQYVFPHPQYAAETVTNDIMLIKLVSSSSAPLVSLNADSATPTVGETVRVIGFGYTKEDGGISSVLNEVDIQVVDFNTCYTEFPGYINYDRQLCASVSGGGKDACLGDSGGPLLDPTTLLQYGLVSFGDGCAESGKSGVYTRVSEYYDWIQKFICANSSSVPASCYVTVKPRTTPSPGFNATIPPNITDNQTATFPPSVNESSTANPSLDGSMTDTNGQSWEPGQWEPADSEAPTAAFAAPTTPPSNVSAPTIPTTIPPTGPPAAGTKPVAPTHRPTPRPTMKPTNKANVTNATASPISPTVTPPTSRAAATSIPHSARYIGMMVSTILWLI